MVLVGGSAYIPKIRSMAACLFSGADIHAGTTSHAIRTASSAQYGVVIGATLEAALMALPRDSDKPRSLSQSSRESEYGGGFVTFPLSQPTTSTASNHVPLAVPTATAVDPTMLSSLSSSSSPTTTTTTALHCPLMEIDPILADNVLRSLLLIEVTPTAYGICLMGALMMPIITRNTTIPCSRSIIVTTAGYE